MENPSPTVKVVKAVLQAPLARRSPPPQPEPVAEAVSQPAGDIHIRLPAVLDINAAPDLKQKFLDAIDQGPGARLLVDAGQVERLATPCIQVLLAAGYALREAGFDFALFQPSDVFIGVFDDLGLFGELMKWKVEA